MVYVSVNILFSQNIESLTYHWEDGNIIPRKNDLVYVSIKMMMAWAIVVEVHDKKPLFETKKISRLLPQPDSFNAFLRQVGQHYLLSNIFFLYLCLNKTLMLTSEFLI